MRFRRALHPFPRKNASRFRSRDVILIGAVAAMLGAGPFVAQSVNAGSNGAPFVKEGGLIEAEEFPERIPVYGPSGQILRWLARGEYLDAVKNRPFASEADAKAEGAPGRPDEIEVEADLSPLDR